jgi:hypothetical protein
MESHMTKSAYTLSEVAIIVRRSLDQVKEDLHNGALSYAIIDGKRMVTLYDLQRYKQWQKKRSNQLLPATPTSLETIDMGAAER